MIFESLRKIVELTKLIIYVFETLEYKMTTVAYRYFLIPTAQSKTTNPTIIITNTARIAKDLWEVLSKYFGVIAIEPAVNSTCAELPVGTATK